MIDVVTVGAGGGSVAWVSPEGSLKVGPRSAGADPGPLCYGRGGTEPTVTDAHLVLGRIPPHLLGGEIPLDVEAARTGLEKLAGRLGLDLERAATGILEISAWNQANALRQVTVKRGLDVRDFTMTTFGGSGSLLLCRLVDILGLATVLVPRDPGNLSAFGLLTVDVRNDYVRRRSAGTPTSTTTWWPGCSTSCGRRPRPRWTGRASPARRTATCASADLRYVGQAFEVRVPVPAGAVGPGVRAARSSRPSTTRTSSSTATPSAATRGSRSSGSTCASPGSGRSSGRCCRRSRLGTVAPDRARTGVRQVYFERLDRHPRLLAA